MIVSVGGVPILEMEARWVLSRAYGIGMDGAAELMSTDPALREAALRVAKRRLDASAGDAAVETE